MNQTISASSFILHPSSFILHPSSFRRGGRVVSDDPRVEQMLDELCDSQATPEEVCNACPELLPQVRERWLELRRIEAEVDALFPNSPGAGAGGPPSTGAA